jgi:hypothetical protein
MATVGASHVEVLAHAPGASDRAAGGILVCTILLYQDILCQGRKPVTERASVASG